MTKRTRFRLKLRAILLILTCFGCVTAYSALAVSNEQPVTQTSTTNDGSNRIFLPLVTSQTRTIESPPMSVSASDATSTHSGNSPVAPPQADTSTFVADTGGGLDQYLARGDVPDGKLTFDIVTPFNSLPAEWMDEDGFLTLIGAITAVNKRAIPNYAKLTLQVYDVDSESGRACSEIDHVFINGRQIEEFINPQPAIVEGKASEWSTFDLVIPIHVLKFPIRPATGNGGALPVVNQIAIEINVQNCQEENWRLEVDWGALSIRPNQNYPIVFAHGWTGSTDSFETFGGFAWIEGIEHDFADLDGGIEPIDATAKKLESEINRFRTGWGTEKVTVFAHSKGGIAIRRALQANPELAEHIANVVTFGSPHHGSDAPKYLGLATCLRSSDYKKCMEAAHEISITNMVNFNFEANCPGDKDSCTYAKKDETAAESIPFYTIVGWLGEVYPASATLPWKATYPPPPELPYPISTNVDGLFPVDNHISIISRKEIYDYAMDLINWHPSTETMNAAQVMEVSTILTSTPTIIWPENAETLYRSELTLTASTLQTIPVQVDSSSEVYFTLYTLEPLTFTLQTPVGTLIDSTVNDPAITYVAQQGTDFSAEGWIYQFRVQNPLAGSWQLALETINATPAVLGVEAISDVRLNIATAKHTYHPGDSVQVEAGLLSGTIPITGTMITGTVEQSDGTQLTLVFHDDGLNGDTTANDGVQVAQFNASTVNDRPKLRVYASKENIVRQSESQFVVAAQSATIQQVIGENPVDSNNNGYFDTLDITLTLDVQTPGEYSVMGTLADSAGHNLTSYEYATWRYSSTLAAGVQAIPLHFYGKSLRQAGINGPYTLTNISVEYTDPNVYGALTVDSAHNLYTTAFYSATQFEGEPLKILGSNSTATDANGDGLYDHLQISVTLDVLIPGSHSWIGELVDATGNHVTGVEGKGQIDSQTPLLFDFWGWQLHDAGINGPYRLTNVYITSLTGQSRIQYFDNLHTTPAYQASNFSTLPLQFSQATHTLLDINSNGLADQLVISATVAGMQAVGDYTWSGRLVAANGSEIATVSGAGRLRNEQAVAFRVNSFLIHNAGLAGPYSLRDVTFLKQTDPAIAAFFPLLYTTPAFAVAQFENWNLTLTGQAAQGVDIDGNGLYDKLVFSTTVAVPWSGEYDIALQLRGQNSAEVTTYGLYTTFNGTSNRAIEFSGEQIANSAINGPYQLSLSDVNFFSATGEVIPLKLSQDIFTSDLFQASQFQSFPVLPPPAAPTLSQPDNPDNDGNYTVSWTPVSDIAYYDLEEKHGGLGTFTTIYTGTTPSIALSNRDASTYCYRMRAMRGLQSSNYSNTVCLTVAQPTPTPTLTPTATATQTPLPLTNAVFYLSAEANGTVAGIAFEDEDILRFDSNNNTWSLYFDGSDVISTTTADLDAIHFENDGSLLFSFDITTTLPGIGDVADNDIVRFVPTSLGATTSGNFTLYFNGSDVDLTTASEDIDAIARTPDGKLLISTLGTNIVGGVPGASHDLMVFTATKLGELTEGTWAMYFDGSDVGLSTTAENLSGASVDATTGDIYLSTLGVYGIPGFSGDGDDILVCTPTSLGTTTTCTWSLYWNGDNNNFGTMVLDALEVASNLQPTATPTSTPLVVATATATQTPMPTATATQTPLPTATSTSIASTATQTAMPTATATEIVPTATPTAAASQIIYIGSDSNGTVGAVSFEEQDILAYNTANATWSLYFDGSDVISTTTADLDAIHFENDGSLLFSFDISTTLPGIGEVGDVDIVRFVPTSLGATTSGNFTLYFDGSDVDLTTASEDIDAIARTPDGKLLISTLGTNIVGGVPGASHDLMVFTATKLGELTEGTWAMYFDGSDVGLSTTAENLSGASVDATTGDIYLSTLGAYGIPGFSGDGDDILVCTPTSLGTTTTCSWSLYWNGDNTGIGSENIDSLELVNPPLVLAAQEMQLDKPVSLIFLPVVQK